MLASTAKSTLVSVKCTIPNLNHSNVTLLRTVCGYACNLHCFLYSDWPVYTSSESSDSEVESIIGTERATDKEAPSSHNTTTSTTGTTAPNQNTSGHVTDPMAQKIMHLLSEISSTMNVDTASDKHFLHCSHCNGPIICV